MPFITEEIWQLLNQVAPQRGLQSKDATTHLMTTAWPEFSNELQNPEIESQFAVFQSALGALRELRSRQNIPNSAEVEFWVRTDMKTTDLLSKMEPYFAGMAHSKVKGMGPDITADALTATVSLPAMEIIVNLKGFLDVDAEIQRQKKQKAEFTKIIKAKENKLSNQNFVSRAPADVVQRERDSLIQMKQQLAAAEDALKRFREATA
jgi:valyl-tRNA synthetase